MNTGLGRTEEAASPGKTALLEGQTGTEEKPDTGHLLSLVPVVTLRHSTHMQGCVA